VFRTATVKTVFDIPAFATRFKNLELLATKENCSPLQLLKRTPGSDELVDLAPLCPQCRNAAEKGEAFCGGCHIRKISFHTFVMNEELHKLESQLDFFDKLMQLSAALTAMQSFSREITHMLELVDSQFCELDVYVLNTRYGRKFRFVKKRYLALMPLLRHRCKAQLTRLEFLWLSYVEGSFCDVEAPDQLFRSIESPARQQRLWRALGDVASEFCAVAKVDLIRQVFMVMDCLMQVSRMSVDTQVVEQVLKYLLKVCCRVGIISTVIVMSAAFMQDSEFRKLCTHDELTVWFLLEGVVLTLIARDEALSVLVMSLQEEIIGQKYLPQN
jgi:hypothetical protein